MKDPQTERRLNFDAVTVTGNCCWNVWNSFVGGQPMSLSTVGRHQPGWFIRAVELRKNCEMG